MIFRRRQPDQPDPLPVAGMSFGRRAFVTVVVVALMGMTAFTMRTGREHWPFSSYPMFAKTRTEARVDHIALVAVPADGSDVFPLFRNDQVAPFGWYRQRRAFQRMLDGAGGVSAAEEGLRNLLARYEAGRLAGQHDGLPLRAIRMYRVDYHIDPHAADLLHDVDRRLIAEVAIDAGGGEVVHDAR